MKLVAFITRAFSRFGRKNAPPQKLDVAALLDDSIKQEIAELAGKLKSERVSVRGLRAEEVPSDVPEIEEKPF